MNVCCERGEDVSVSTLSEKVRFWEWKTDRKRSGLLQVVFLFTT